MKKLYFLLLVLPMILLLGACSTSKEASITDVNYDNQVTGKGQRTSFDPDRTFAPLESDAEITETEQQQEVLGIFPDESTDISEGMPEEVSPKNKKEPVQQVEKDVLEDKAKLASEPIFTKKEQRQLRKEIKQELKAQLKPGSGTQSTGATSKPMLDVVLLILSFLLPPLAVGLAVGIGKTFWLNVVLTLLGFLPGVIHAIIVVTRNT